MIANRKAISAVFLLASTLVAGTLTFNSLCAEQLTDSIAISKLSSSDTKTNALFKKIRLAIEKNNLTKTSNQCLALDLEETTSEGFFFVGVREIHNSSCGGDPDTSPRVFGVQVNRTMEKMWSDAASDAGGMEAISAP
jgi:hypothetical protein